jgi:alpha-beta hydrolase superfamily lysophospholipase
MDLKNDYTSQTLQLADDYEGKATAVLTSSNDNTGDRKSVLCLHGYIDYFFHPHLGEHFNGNGFDFHALDLRKYGRALMEHQHPNYCKSLDEYFEEISMAIESIQKTSNAVYLLGHSTGGLIASCYMNSGKYKNNIKGLILNSPFLDFYQSNLAKSVGYFAANLVSSLFVYSKLEGVLSPAYPQSLHKDFYGEWDFNLDWKPIKGLPTYFKWVVAIAKAQRDLKNSTITVPILILHASASKKYATFSKEVFSKDIVLDIEDIKRVGVTLGDDVTLVKVDNALHDIFLSQKAVREIAFEEMFSWLATTDFKK